MNLKFQKCKLPKLPKRNNLYGKNVSKTDEKSQLEVEIENENVRN
jgi:hypothetical protein